MVQLAPQTQFFTQVLKLIQHKQPLTKHSETLLTNFYSLFLYFQCLKKKEKKKMKCSEIKCAEH